MELEKDNIGNSLTITEKEAYEMQMLTIIVM